MSVGGYSLCKYSWTGTGDNTWSTGETITPEQRLVRVLSNIVQTLCENSQWTMDTRYHSSTTDYTPSSEFTMQNYNVTGAGETNKICLLTNGSLYLAIGISNGAAKLNPDNLLYPVIFYGSTLNTTNAITGLYFSISSSGNWTSSNDYGISLPQDATKWSSFGRTKQFTGNLHYYNFVNDNNANVIYSYYFLTKENHIAIFEKCSSWGPDKIKCVIMGNLIGSLAHSTDANILSCISLSENEYRENQNADRGESTIPISSLINDYYINQETNYSVRIYNSNSNTQIFRADNTIANPYDSTSNTGVGMSVSNEIQLDSTISNASDGGTRWCPLQVYIQSNNPTLYGVVENDGFKGYINTDFLRAVPINTYNVGSTFGQSKEFYYIGGGLAIGWDDSISESLF